MEEIKQMKSFIYLDEYKMFSISSQIFEGLTEYILDSNKESIQEENTQKGKIGSGQVMADILSKERTSTEKRYLHDYAFNLFESELTKKDKINSTLNNITTKPFIKVKGKAMFNDYSMLLDMVRNFNNIGEAIGYMTNPDLHDELNNLKKSSKQLNNRNNASKGKYLINKVEEKLTDTLIKQGLMMKQDFLDRIETILDYGYGNLFEINLFDEENTIILSSVLDRKYLREEESILISKYSRKTEVDFTIFGILTQSGKDKFNSDVVFASDTNEEEGMKRASKGIVNAMANVENAFIGRLKNEYVIDPIAVYREL